MMNRVPATRNHEPGSLLRQFTSEIDRLFDPDLPAFNGGIQGMSEWTPAVDVREEENRYVIQADVPGMQPEDLEVTMENGVLSIRGERRHESEKEHDGARHVERSYGSFLRRFSLPDAVSDDDVKARIDKGVLNLEINKREESRPKKIEIQS